MNVTNDADDGMNVGFMISPLLSAPVLHTSPRLRREEHRCGQGNRAGSVRANDAAF